jgi:hypothetical protein
VRFSLLTGMLLVVAGIATAQTAGDWLTGATGRGTARWSQQGDILTYRGGATFGWAVLRGISIRDGSIAVRFKPVEGREDRAGGVVWRWQDADNYYVARGNALENNVVVYKIVGGRRTDLPPLGAPRGTYGMKAPVATGAPHTLRVDFSGSDFAVTLDGKRLFVVRDETFATPGAVGVWSKADSVTEFDQLQYSGS